MTSPETLASCPWAGSEHCKPGAVFVLRDDDGTCVACSECGVRGPIYGTDEAAIVAWNSRESSSRWRSVEEEMPEKGVEVLAWCANGSRVVAFLRHSDHLGHVWMSKPGEWSQSVTKWMPLPAGPGEEE